MENTTESPSVESPVTLPKPQRKTFIDRFPDFSEFKDIEKTGYIFPCVAYREDVGVCGVLTGFIFDIPGTPGAHCCSKECREVIASQTPSQSNEELTLEPQQDTISPPPETTNTLDQDKQP